jgi:hypothetical protein
MIREVLFFLVGVFIREIIAWAAEGQKKKKKPVKMEKPMVESCLDTKKDQGKKNRPSRQFSRFERM